MYFDQLDYISSLRFVHIGYLIQLNGEIMDANTKLIALVVVGLLAGVGVGYGVGFLMDSDDAEYHFYVYFDDGDDRNGWYSAKGSDAAVGFDRAMKAAGFEYELGGGYLSMIDDAATFWSVYDYLYLGTDNESASSSVLEPVYSYGALAYSNGWKSFMGFGGYDDGQPFKILQSVSTIFFLSMYDDLGYAPNPVDFDDWMSAGPFKA